MTTDDHRLDLERRSRLGMVEASWGEHKSVDQLVRIITTVAQAGELVLATRIDADKAEAVLTLLGDAAVRYDAEARCLVALTPRRLVEAWVEVFNIAGARLERLASAQSCQLVALQAVLGDSDPNELVLLLNTNSDQVRLMFLREGLPVFERSIPREGRSVVNEIDRSVLFYRR